MILIMRIVTYWFTVEVKISRSRKRRWFRPRDWGDAIAPILSWS